MKHVTKRNNVTSYISVLLIPRYIKLLVWLLQLGNPRSYFILGERIAHLHKFSGSLYTVKYLKEATRLVQKYVSGEIVVSSMDAGLGISGGIPKIVPGDLRLLIRSRDQQTIRAVLSILGLFRILRCTSKLKLETITDPFKGKSSELPV
jgi:hypothetical protein